MLSVQGLCYHKGGTAFLTDIHFETFGGSILGVIGPNGAGKTTLMRALLNDIESTAGEVLLDDQLIGQVLANARARRVAMLSQSSELRFSYTVEEVVLLGRIPHASGRLVDEQIVAAAMALMDITYLRGRCYTDLSGGEKQRTQLARVMAQIWRAEDASGSRLLILDEPTSSLDLGHKQQLMQAIHTFAAQGVAVVLIEHDLNVVAHHCDDLLVLQCGCVKAYGKTSEILTESLIKAVFNADVRVIKDQNQLTVIG